MFLPVKYPALHLLSFHFHHPGTLILVFWNNFGQTSHLKLLYKHCELFSLCMCFFFISWPQFFDGWISLSTKQISIQWIVIYLLESLIHPLNNQSLVYQVELHTIHVVILLNRILIHRAACSSQPAGPWAQGTSGSGDM